ncbi:MAG: hypothetical protein HOH33_05795 [Verrucomicrobia bacterium]|nr:hypothetical protein [Verrucomicrobiota bacterium]
MIVGGEAVIHYGHAGLTGDVDLFFDQTTSNLQALLDVLLEFWNGDVPGLQSAEDLREEGIILQFGCPPNKIDRTNQIDDIQFTEALNSRTTILAETAKTNVPVYFLGLRNLIRNKEASGHLKNQDDSEFLRNFL